MMGRRKAEQIRATGAEIVVSPCANCKKQLKEVCEDNGLDDVEVVGLHDLVLKVIDLGPQTVEPAKAERPETSKTASVIGAACGRSKRITVDGSNGFGAFASCSCSGAASVMMATSVPELQSSRWIMNASIPASTTEPPPRSEASKRIFTWSVELTLTVMGYRPGSARA